MPTKHINNKYNIKRRSFRIVANCYLKKVGGEYEVVLGKADTLYLNP
jgi:hypothetical protein